jgi:DNA recombination protein RmuC
MADWIGWATLVLAGAAALCALLGLLRSGRGDGQGALRDEFERARHAAEEQARGLRQEVADALRGHQEVTQRGLREQAEHLDARIDRMGEEATHNRDTLRTTIETRLETAAERQANAARDLRDEVAASVQRLQEALRQIQTERFDAFARQLAQSLGTLDQRSLDTREALQLALAELGRQQKERLDIVGEALRQMTERQEKGQEALRLAVEGRLDAIRQESQAKLDEMRRTVDERLQTTLEQRLGESFNRVVEQLERVHKGIGEMQTLAAGVGDLKKVLSNVTVRGAFGEVQLAMLLEQFLSPEQLIENAVMREGTQERVEFAVRLPGRDGENEVLLPIDAKFPQEDYLRLVEAGHIGDADAVAEAGRALEMRIRLFAKTIREKYVHPPRTTDFAILFLPTESLYAEVLRRPGLFEQIQRDFHVTLTGPATLTAFLNALQMGFRSLAIEKRSSEVWQVLGAVRSEFAKYNEVVDRIGKQLTTAAKSVETLGTRTRAMNRKLRDVERLPDAKAQALLGLEGDGTAADEEDGEPVDMRAPAALIPPKPELY